MGLWVFCFSELVEMNECSHDDDVDDDVLRHYFFSPFPFLSFPFLLFSYTV